MMMWSVNVVNREDSLEAFLQRETGVEQYAILAYLSDGRRLTTENVRDLAGAHDEVRLASREGWYLLIAEIDHLCVQQVLSR